MNPRTPVLVGVGQYLNHIENLDQACEPVEMMLKAARLAAADTDAGTVLAQVQSVRVIRGIWRYQNPARWIADRIGVPGVETLGTLFGGNQVQAVVNRTALEILNCELDVALIAGAENGYSAGKARQAGVKLPVQDAPGDYDVLVGAQKPEHHEYEEAQGIRTAIQVYPMYENAIRHHRGETIDEHLHRVSELWSRFNDVAQQNPNAWIQKNVTAEEIRTASETNRPISFPYNKLMNANLSVDMSAALIMCSVAKAQALNIDESKWIYPLAGVQGYDHFSASVRDNFYTSPGIRIVGARVLELAETDSADLAHVDLYSCFPAAVQIAATELGLDQARPLTVTGGLTFGGGPLNNYVMHAVARTVELLRETPGKEALVTANGGNLYKHVHGVYASRPPRQDFRYDNVQSQIDALPARSCLPEFRGDVTLESYSVMYRGDEPVIGHCACLTPGGERVWVNTQDRDLTLAMTREEFCGRAARIDSHGELIVL
jgi:acetyl-CoA C-acetyltransferase